MPEIKLGEIESRFADIIWTNEPLQSRELAKMAEKALGWKKTTAFTVLKRLCDREMFQNEGGIVTVRISREEFYARQSEEYLQDSFGGSLPAFVAAFARKKDLKQEQIEEILRIIEEG